ncbi:MAG: RNA-binding protein [Nitrospirota bacterium]
MTITLHLSGLPSFWSDTTLHKTFAQFGTVVSATIVRDPFGHSLGLGLVQLCQVAEPAVEIHN